VPRKGRPRRRSLTTDPFFGFAVLAAAGVATWSLNQPLRLTLLWAVLFVFALVYASGRRMSIAYSYSDLARGAVAGLLMSGPILLTASGLLLGTSQRLFPVQDTLALFWGVVLLMPAAEALYFRGFLQEERGLWASVLLYAGAGVVYFLPVTWDGHLPVLAILVGGMGLLGFVYGYLRAMYGLAASAICQVVVHCVLFLVPHLVQGFAAP
jgi:hypothetical protein